jgi:peptidoglycan/LPS O-acetylase OafA/YrhL
MPLVSIMTDTSDEQPPQRRATDIRFALLLALLAFVWVANGSGLTSSNDGSHLALARALILRGEAAIDPDRALTLEVDLAEREGRVYSDRPPGTAFAALPAVWLGDRLDPIMLERAQTQARAGREVAPLPAARPYITTYAARSAAAKSRGPRLAALIGTSIATSIHAALVGLLGIILLDRLLRARGVSANSRLIALACLGLATAWGPYAAVLFAHGSAATAVAGFLLGVASLAREPDRRRAGWIAALTGLAGAWAIACDYVLVLAIVPAAALTIPWRRWGLAGLGAAPIVLATAAYHTAAFGGPLAIGYDFQTNFEFARERGSTFSGDPLEGLWVLWGLGRGAGVLAQAPIVLVGLAALRTRGDPLVRALLGFLPWIVALALHRTPSGGGTGDHRYLIPILPFAAIGLALAWDRAKPAGRVGLVAVAVASATLVWRHFLSWHDADPFSRPGLAALVAAPILLAALAVAVRARKHA